MPERRRAASRHAGTVARSGDEAGRGQIECSIRPLATLPAANAMPRRGKTQRPLKNGELE